MVLAPSDMICMGEAVISCYPAPSTIVWGETGLDAAALLRPESPYYSGVMYEFPGDVPGVQANKQRHGRRWNIGFCDGHIETLRPRQVFYFKDDTIARRWNRDHQPHNAGFVEPPPYTWRPP
jgi:prepilin-type processing-associated H-X9-DG protein